jgi:hypothetical protein
MMPEARNDPTPVNRLLSILAPSQPTMAPRATSAHVLPAISTLDPSTPPMPAAPMVRRSSELNEEPSLSL